MSNVLMAGIAKSKITPPVGISLTGYASRPGPATGIHDELYSKAVVFSNGKTQAAAAALDLLGLDFEQMAWIRNECEKRTGIPGQNIFVVCSHTHAGPATMLLRFCGTRDQSYLSWMLGKVVESIENAAGDLQPCRIETGECVCDLAINRRHRASDGSIHLADNAGGSVDPRVGLVRVVRENGPGAVIYNYACHGVVLGNENTEVSADWIGAASAFIERETGDTAIFLQGCCGNINPRIRGGFDAVEEAGKLVGQAVIDALGSLKPSQGSEISVASKKVSLPFQTLPPRDELLSLQKEMNQQVEAARSQGKPEYTLDWLKGVAEWSGAALERIDNQQQEKSQQIELALLRIDGIGIFAIPGEVFVEFAHRVKSLSPDVLVAGYANGNIGYIPTAQAFTEGGYEVDAAYKLYGVQMIGPESEGIILETAKELLGQV